MTAGTVDGGVGEEDEEGEEQGDHEEEGLDEGKNDGDDGEEGEGGEGIKVWLLQVCILANTIASQASNGLKRGPLTALAHSTPASRSRGALTSSASGQNVTLAQLLSLQGQTAAEGETGDGDDAASQPPQRSALNMFGNIR